MDTYILYIKNILIIQLVLLHSIPKRIQENKKPKKKQNKPKKKQNKPQKKQNTDHRTYEDVVVAQVLLF